MNTMFGSTLVAIAVIALLFGEPGVAATLAFLGLTLLTT